MRLCDTMDFEGFLDGRIDHETETEIVAHLDNCSDCRERLENCAAPPGLQGEIRQALCLAATDGASRSTDFGPGLELGFLTASDDPQMLGRIGSYEVMGVVGRGGMGIVFKAWEVPLQRVVAIKVLDPLVARVGAARSRFAREARAMASISHERVMPVFSVNEHQGLPYLVMAYVAGGTLEHHLACKGPLETSDVLRVACQVADALAEAHRLGLIHRDIKPGNILLDHGLERIRVADFGLVRVVDDASQTRSGVVAGTPQYMSPEQIRGEVCDGRSDLFSLGSVMYALCTGHPPFRAESTYGMMQRIANDAPRPLRECSPRHPAWLEEFITRLLAKEKRERFDSARTVADLLREELVHLENPTTTREPAREWRPVGPSKWKKLWRRLPGSWMQKSSAMLFLMAVVLFLSNNLRNPIDKAAEPPMPNDLRELMQPPAQTVTAPHWDRDGTVETLHQVNTLRSQWMAPEVENDPWSQEVQQLHHDINNAIQKMSSLP